MKNKKVSFWKQILSGLLTTILTFLSIILFVTGVLSFYISVSIIVATLILGGLWMTRTQEKERKHELEKLQKSRRKLERLRRSGVKI